MSTRRARSRPCAIAAFASAPDGLSRRIDQTGQRALACRDAYRTAGAQWAGDLADVERRIAKVRAPHAPDRPRGDRGQGPFGPGEPIAIGPFTAVVVPRAVSAVRAAVGASSVSIEDPALARPAPLVVAIARSTVSIVIHGETGTGKEVLSRSLHELSGRPGPLLGINCAALAPLTSPG